MVPNYLQHMIDSEAAPDDVSKPFGGRKPANIPAPNITHFELARTLERVNRRFAAFMQSEMTRRGVEEIGHAHLMLLLAIGDDEISVTQLMERGPYAGTNLSYYLKQLGESGYIERNALQRDRRAARIKLSEKGKELCADMTAIAANCHKIVADSPENIRNLEITFKTLDRIEQTWASAAIFGPRGE